MLSLTQHTSALTGCDDCEARKREDGEVVGGCIQGLVNGYTMCRETRSGTLQQTALSSRGEERRVVCDSPTSVISGSKG